MRKDARYDSDNKPLDIAGTRRLYDRVDAPSDYAGARRRNSTNNNVATNASQPVAKNRRGRKPKTITTKKSTVSTSQKTQNNKKVTKTTKSQTSQQTSQKTAYIPAVIATSTNKKDSVTDNIKSTVSDSSNLLNKRNGCQNCTSCNSQNDNCCNIYNVRRLENLVFFVCVALAVAGTLFVQDHKFLSNLKLFPQPQTGSAATAVPAEQKTEQVESSQNNETTKDTSSANTQKVQNSVETTTQNLQTKGQPTTEQNVPQLYQSDVWTCFDFETQPITITIVIEEAKVEESQQQGAVVNMCQPPCCQDVDLYAGGYASIEAENVFIVQDDLNVLGCGGVGGGGASFLQQHSENLGKPIYTSPINWGVPPLRQTQYGGSFSLSSSRSSTTYNNYPCYTLHPPSPGSLATIFVFSTLHNFLRFRFV